MNYSTNNDLVSIPGKQLFPTVREILFNGTSFKLVVTGNSMLPFLKHTRDSVILTGITGYTIKRGDIVLVRRDNGIYVLHRALKILPDGFIMNGDAQTWDEFVPYEQVFARANRIERKGKLISCDHKLYCFCSEIWMLLRPFRGFLLKSVGLLLRIYRRAASFYKSRLH